jgi:acyl carrier protein
MNDLSTSLRQFIRENFLFGADDSFSDDASLVEHGIVDSTGVLELIAHIESTYDLQIDDEELVPENLDSIDNLTRFISEKRPVGASTS